MMHAEARAANKLTPGPIPRFIKSGREKSIAAAASMDRAKSLPANSDAAYAGYVRGR